MTSIRSNAYLLVASPHLLALLLQTVSRLSHASAPTCLIPSTHLLSPTAQKRRAPGGESGIDGDQTPTGRRTATDVASAFGNTPEEEPMPKILSHKARRKAKRRLVSVSK